MLGGCVARWYNDRGVYFVGDSMRLAIGKNALRHVASGIVIRRCRYGDGCASCPDHPCWLQPLLAAALGLASRCEKRTEKGERTERGE